ncbi:hypothetical protein [Streptomyces achromogenes]|uniref:hypothetical protein n=1 Tax=Streptomyces achromogenes TaxID=67255 RepID=UPI003402A667
MRSCSCRSAKPRACFAADLAALIEVPVPRGVTPNAFIDLVEEVSDVLGSSSLGTWQDASEDLDHAAGYLTDALTSPRQRPARPPGPGAHPPARRHRDGQVTPRPS